MDLSFLLQCHDPIHGRRIFEFGQEKFMAAMDCLPRADIKYIEEIFPGIEVNEVRMMLVNTRWTNPICGNCGDKTSLTLPKLELCNKCHLEWYCSRQCRKAHKTVHRLRCGKINGPLDVGYQKMVVIPIDSPTSH